MRVRVNDVGVKCLEDAPLGDLKVINMSGARCTCPTVLLPHEQGCAAALQGELVFFVCDAAGKQHELPGKYCYQVS